MANGEYVFFPPHSQRTNNIDNELDEALSKTVYTRANSETRLNAKDIDVWKWTHFWTFLRQHKHAANMLIDETVIMNEI